MASYWLRVEAQNLASFISDTQDLSTARGGSLALLDVIGTIPVIADRRGIVLDQVTTGASTGLWRFGGDDDGEAAAVADAVRRGLAGSSGEGDDLAKAASHATFRVVVAPETAGHGSSAGDYTADDQAMVALVRRQQMSSAGLVYPQEEGRGREVCDKDRVRPAATKTKAGVLLSRSVQDRRRYGVRAKQRFYEQRLRDAGRSDLMATIGSATAPFALQLGSISEEQDEVVSADRSLRRALSGKVCVLYMDGNSFGDLQTEFIAAGSDAVERQREFDDKLKLWRCQLLADIINTLLVASPPARGKPCDDEDKLREEIHAGDPSSQVIRFETLLWGGDEMMFVVPARFGWEIAQRICEITAGWRLEISKGQFKPLHHAIGLVFCHHDAPISRIQALAHDLAEHAKDLSIATIGGKMVAGAGRGTTFVVPTVLESFDHIGDDLSDFFDRRVRPELGHRLGPTRSNEQLAERDRDFALSAEEILSLKVLTEATAGLVTGIEPLPRRRLRRIANAIHRGDASWRKSVVGLLREGPEWIKDAIAPDSSAPFSDHFRRLGVDRAFLLIEEHRDYFMPLVSNEPGDGEA